MQLTVYSDICINKKDLFNWTSLFYVTVHPALAILFRALLEQLTRIRFPYGTRKNSLIAASFRTWRGSWVSIAQDPIVNATFSGQTPQ